RGIGLEWLVINSPLPYLARVMIAGHSAVAAFLGGVLDAWAARATWGNPEVRFQHLESILRAARDEMRQRGIPFVVVVLPSGICTPHPSSEFSSSVLAITQKLGVPALDTMEPLQAAVARGEHPIQPDGSHFNDEGHLLIAKWLHERLAVTAGLAVK